jgi:hypothetical protein
LQANIFKQANNQQICKLQQKKMENNLFTAIMFARTDTRGLAKPVRGHQHDKKAPVANFFANLVLQEGCPLR